MSLYTFLFEWYNNNTNTVCLIIQYMKEMKIDTTDINNYNI